MQDIFEMLQELLEQQQFELLIEECHTTPGDIPLVYLMNDAVESFLVFKQAKLTGSYIKDYERISEGFIKSGGRAVCTGSLAGGQCSYCIF